MHVVLNPIVTNETIIDGSVSADQGGFAQSFHIGRIQHLTTVTKALLIKTDFTLV
jgi:hypothetical protein